jgi:hypothetical protein
MREVQILAVLAIGHEQPFDFSDYIEVPNIAAHALGLPPFRQ